jgi:4-carboxymuconolactone decarboxylase
MIAAQQLQLNSLKNKKIQLVKKTIIAFTAIFLFGFCNHTKSQDMQNSLDKKKRSIVTIAAHTAMGNLDKLKLELSNGLDAGLTVNEIKEVLVQLYAYCGFPRSLQGINTFMALLEERKAKGITDETGKDASPIKDTADKYEQGRKVLETLTGQPQPKPAKGYGEFSPVIDRFLKEHLFADIFGRDVLSYADRELATIAALASLKGVEPMLQSHMNIGMNLGMTEMQLREVLAVIENSIGIQEAETGRKVLSKVLENRK